MWMEPTQWFASLDLGVTAAVVYLGWLLAEVVNQLIGRGLSGVGAQKDRGSFWVIIGSVNVGMMGAFWLRGLRVGLVGPDWQYVGLGMMAAGIVFRQYSIAILGRAFSVRVEIQPEQHLVMRGPYRWLRHPSYTGSLMTLAGAPLALGTWAGVVFCLLLVLPAYAYRAAVEERALQEAFGEEYREYRMRTWRFLPGW